MIDTTIIENTLGSHALKRTCNFLSHRYRRDRHSLYAGGMVRSSRRMMRSRSTGVTGQSSDSDKEQRDSPTLTSNKTGTTEADSRLDYNVEAEEKENNGSQNSDSNTDCKHERHVKSNGSLSEKPPSGRRRARSGGQKIHPVITLQVAEDGSTMRLNEGEGDGLDNETFDGMLEVRDESGLNGQRTPPLQDVEKLGGIPLMQNTTDNDKHLTVETMNIKPPKVPAQKPHVLKGCTEQNGTLLRSVIPESRKEASAVEETSIESNKVDNHGVTFA